MVMGKLGIRMQKNKVGLALNIINKNQLKIDQNLNVRPRIIKLTEKYTGWKFQDIRFGNEVLDMIKGNIRKYRQLNLLKI